MKNFFLIMLLVVLPFCAQGGAEARDVPSGKIFDTPPFTTATLFSSIVCGENFACDTYATPTQYMSMADTCANQRYGFPVGMMRYYETSGEYENCALPDRFAPKGGTLGANAQWPVCCITEMGNNQCQFTCHYFISNSTGG